MKRPEDPTPAEQPHGRVKARANQTASPSVSSLTSAIQAQQTRQNTEHAISNAEMEERHNKGE